MNFGYSFSAKKNTSGGPSIPREGLLFKAMLPSLVDSVGESSILFQSGDASTWLTTAVWGFEYTVDTAAIDTALGGGVLFVGVTPKYMTWAQWMIVAQINVNYLFIGIKGAVGYDIDQTANATKIRRYLNSVDEELLISDIFNGFDLNGYTVSNSPVVPDQDGALRISATGSLACEGGFFATTLAEGAVLGADLWTNPASNIGAGWVYNGDGTYTATASNALMFGSLNPIIGQNAQIVFEIINVTSGQVRPVTSGLGTNVGTVGVFSEVMFAANSSIGLSAVAFTGVIRILSVKVVVPVWIERTPAPAKKAVRTLTGNKTVYADTDPTAWPRACVNPTRTNKCTCRKINPVNTTNITTSGDAAAVLSVVDDTTALAAAGLDKICTSGKVYKLDNSAGTTEAIAIIGGTTGNTNSHSHVVYGRGEGWVGRNGTLKTDINTAVFLPFVYVGLVSSSGNLQVGTLPGQILYFILPQLEEGAYTTDPIITAADPLASVTRTGTSITKPTAGLFPMVSETEAQNFGIYTRFNLKAAGQVAKLLASYTDANNCTCLDVTATTIVFGKKLAGTDITVNRAITHAANVPIDVLAIQTDMGMSIKVRSYSGGAWSAWSAWTDDATANGKLAAKIAATLELGSANSTSHMYGNIPLESILKLGNRATLAEYQAVAEAEINKINA